MRRGCISLFCTAMVNDNDVRKNGYLITTTGSCPLFWILHRQPQYSLSNSGKAEWKTDGEQRSRCSTFETLNYYYYKCKKLKSLKQCLTATRPNHTTKTAKIKKVLSLRSTLTLWRRAAKVIAPF